MALIFSAGKMPLKYLHAGPFLHDPIKQICLGTAPASAQDVSPVRNWEATGVGKRARPWGGCLLWQPSHQGCPRAPQCVCLGLILLLFPAFPAGSSLYVGIMPLSPPCDGAHPCPACSATSGTPVPSGLNLLGCSNPHLCCGKPPPANPTS